MSGKLKEVRERIKSVNSTQQITKAMKMVSAAKLRKAQQAIQQMRPYANRLDLILKNILSNLQGDYETSFGVEREASKILVVLVTSNRGLCGAFNSNLSKLTVQTVEEKYGDQLAAGNLKLLCIGKRGNDLMKRKYGANAVISDYVDIFSDLTFNNISRVSQYLMDAFTKAEFDRIEVCYSRFKNAAVQTPEMAQYLPVQKISTDSDFSSNADYIFEPNTVELLDELIPSILHTTFLKFILDTHASEHGARMTAMDNATTNADELMKELKISYNKARQEAITKELAEIVGGAAALSS